MILMKKFLKNLKDEKEFLSHLKNFHMSLNQYKNKLNSYIQFFLNDNIAQIDNIPILAKMVVKLFL